MGGRFSVLFLQSRPRLPPAQQPRTPWRRLLDVFNIFSLVRVTRAVNFWALAPGHRAAFDGLPRCGTSLLRQGGRPPLIYKVRTRRFLQQL